MSVNEINDASEYENISDLTEIPKDHIEEVINYYSDFKWKGSERGNLDIFTNPQQYKIRVKKLPFDKHISIRFVDDLSDSETNYRKANEYEEFVEIIQTILKENNCLNS